MDKVLTVVIPTYNMENLLFQCLDSLIVDADLMPKLEVLVINDGSKDKSSEIAHGYERKHPETFRVIDKENGNYGSCVNRGLQEAKGKYIKVLDADDSFDNSNFRLFLEYLLTTDSDLVISDVVRWDAMHHVVAAYHYNLPTGKVFSFDVFYSTLDLEMHALTYKVDLLRSIGYKQTEGISYTDTEWSILPMIEVKSMSYFDSPVYMYLVGRDGQTIAPEVYIRNYDQVVVILRRIIGMLPKDVFVSKQYIQNRLVRIIKYLYSKVLLYNNIGKDISSLCNFDRFIKETNPELYDILGEISIHKIIPYKYVEEWRRSKYTSVSKNCMRLAQLVPKIRKISNRLRRFIS